MPLFKRGTLWLTVGLALGGGLAGAFSLAALKAQQSQASALGSFGSKPAVGRVHRDVAADWDYSCPAGVKCLQAPVANPAVTVAFAFNKAEAVKSYGAIQKWDDFQLEYLTNGQQDYKKIVRDEQVYRNYYLPPHAMAGKAQAQWQVIYESLNPVVQDAYAAAVDAGIESLLASNARYELTYPAALDEALDLGSQATLNLGALLAEKLGAGAMPQRVGAKQKLLDALLAGESLPEIGADYEQAIGSALNEVALAVGTAFRGFANFAGKKLADNAFARSLLGSAGATDAFDKELNAIRNFDPSLFAVLPEDDVRMLRLYLQNSWSAAQFSQALADQNLNARLAEVLLSETPVTDVPSLNLRLAAFLGLASKLDAVVRTNAYFPAAADAARVLSNYGPGAVSQLFSAIAKTTNFASAVNGLNPSLAQLHEQNAFLQSAGLFAAQDLDGYRSLVIQALFSGQPLYTHFTNLLAKALPQGEWTADLTAAANYLQTNRQDLPAVQLAVERLRAALYKPFVPSMAAFAALLAIGAFGGLLSFGAGYALVRGFLVKRKYGVSALEYGRSRLALTSLVFSGVVVAAVLIALAVSGVF